MFEDSSLFLLASSLRSVLAGAITGLEISDVLIGTPKQAGEIVSSGGQSPSNALNLFFYRFSAGSYPSVALPSEPLFIRAHCLLTAFAGKGNSSTPGGAGQNDLRLLGEAMRVLHQNPQIDLPQTEPLAAVQIVPAFLSIQELNQVWSMMGAEVSYRPSTAYELALVPIPLVKPVDRKAKVAGLDSGAAPSEDPGADARLAVPRVALVVPEGLAYALSLPVSERPATVTLRIEGRPSEQVILRWRLLEDPNAGWTDGPSSAAVVLAGDGDDATTHELELPLTVAGQAMVFAEVVGDPSRVSRPVLVILFEEEASP